MTINENFKLRWTVANALGMSLAFLATLQLLEFYKWGFNFDNHWVFGADDGKQLSFVAFFLHQASALTLFGLIFGFAQSRVLRDPRINTKHWVLTGVLGYLALLVVILPLYHFWGEIPGPFEPITLTLLGPLFMILFQWRLIKKQRLNPKLPLLLFFLGAFIGVVMIAIIFSLGLDVLWAVEIAITGLLIGGMAGLLSANHFDKMLNEGGI